MVIGKVVSILLDGIDLGLGYIIYFFIFKMNGRWIENSKIQVMLVKFLVYERDKKIKKIGERVK